MPSGIVVAGGILVEKGQEVKLRSDNFVVQCLLTDLIDLGLVPLRLEREEFLFVDWGRPNVGPTPCLGPRNARRDNP